MSTIRITGSSNDSVYTGQQRPYSTQETDRSIAMSPRRTPAYPGSGEFISINDEETSVSTAVGSLIDVDPVVIAEVAGEVLSCIASRPRARGTDYYVFVGTTAGKIYRSVSTTDYRTFDLVYDSGDATEQINGMQYCPLDSKWYSWTTGGSGNGQILRSADSTGGAWTSVYTSSHASIRVGNFNSGIIMLFGTGGDGANAHIYSSPDGTTWTSRLTAASYEIYDIKWASTLAIFAAVTGGGGTPRIYSSLGGNSWTARLNPASGVVDVPSLVYFDPVGNTDVFLVPNAGAPIAGVYASVDGTTWAATELCFSYAPAGLFSWNGEAYAVAANANDDFLRKHIWTLTGAHAWRTRLFTAGWAFNGNFTPKNDRLLFINGTDGNVYQWFELQLLAF